MPESDQVDEETNETIAAKVKPINKPWAGRFRRIVCVSLLSVRINICGIITGLTFPRRRGPTTSDFSSSQTQRDTIQGQFTLSISREGRSSYCTELIGQKKSSQPDWINPKLIENIEMFYLLQQMS